METDWLWECFAMTGNIDAYMAWKEQQKTQQNVIMQKEKDGYEDGSHQGTRNSDRGSFHG